MPKESRALEAPVGPPWLMTSRGGSSPAGALKSLFCGGVKPGVRTQPALGGEIERLGDGDVARVEGQGSALADDLHLQIGQGDGDDLWAAKGTGGDQPQAPIAPVQAVHEGVFLGRGGSAIRGQDGVGEGNAAQIALGSDEAQILAAILAVQAGQRTIGQEGVIADAEDPLRQAKIGVQGRQGDGLARGGVPAVKIPPAGAVGGKVQAAIGAPLGLVDGLVWPAGEALRIAQAVRGEIGQPQLAAIPGHIGMIPAQPGQLPSVRAGARVRVEITARGDDLRLAAGGGDKHQLVVGAEVILVALADTDKIFRLAGGGGDDAPVSVAQPPGKSRRRGERGQLAVRQEIEALIAEIGKEEPALVDEIRAAAVLMHGGANV